MNVILKSPPCLMYLRHLAEKDADSAENSRDNSLSPPWFIYCRICVTQTTDDLCIQGGVLSDPAFLYANEFSCRNLFTFLNPVVPGR